MTTKTIEERLDFIEFRQDLLFENSQYSRMLYDYNVTRQEHEAIMDIMNEFRNKIEAGEEVHHGTFERKIYEAVLHKNGIYHFAESVAQENHRRGSWEEVFVSLYGDMPKFQNYLVNQD